MKKKITNISINNLETEVKSYTPKHEIKKVAEDEVHYKSEDLEKIISKKQKEMEKAAKNLDFLTAAKIRDEIQALKDKMEIS